MQRVIDVDNIRQLTRLYILRQQRIMIKLLAQFGERSLSRRVAGNTTVAVRSYNTLGAQGDTSSGYQGELHWIHSWGGFFFEQVLLLKPRNPSKKPQCLGPKNQMVFRDDLITCFSNKFTVQFTFKKVKTHFSCLGFA